jgi:hypothetical protein
VYDYSKNNREKIPLETLRQVAALLETVKL